MSSLIPGLLPTDISTMALGLSHSLSRHKLKFSPDKIDTMIVQAIALLDDLDKELNVYAMRVKEWYGWHFPEMAKIINDNLAYSRVILKMGMRTKSSEADLAEILPEEIETAVKAAAEVSMGTEIATDDLENIQALAQQVVDFTEYRQKLSGYLSARMAAIAPNLTVLVGDLVGARLIAHAGSLMSLAKSPASTIQILGAEKALFRALKTKHDTPKYGLIYHASLVGQATGKNKGKIARMLAAKAALSLRVDALSEWGIEGEAPQDEIPEELKSELGIESRVKIERRLARMEGRPIKPRGVAIAPNGVSSQPGKWEIKEARKYNKDADGLAGDEPAAAVSKVPKIEDLTLKAAESKDVVMDDRDEELDAIENDDDEDEEMVDVGEEAKEVEAEAEEEDEGEDQDEDDGDDDEAEEEEEEEKEKESEKAKEVGPHKESKTKKEKKSKSSEPSTSRPPISVDTNKAANGDKNHEHSDTISTISEDSPDSPDSPTQQETNWQSSILGNTKEAKKARKKERHERKLALSAERSEARKIRNEKLARRLERKERRVKRQEQQKRRQDRDNDKLAPLAKAAGLSVTRYKRKLERGEIKFGADGTPVAISKKDIKKAKRAEEKAAKAEPIPEENGASSSSSKKKRKRDDEGTEKSEKKKKKKTKA